MQHLIGEITPRQAQGGVDLIGLPSSIPDLNYLTGGYRNDEMYIVGGATGSGKSSFCLTEAIHLARQEAHVLYVSLEMSAKILALRSIAALTNLPAMKIEKGQMTDESFAFVKKTAQEFQDLPLYFHDSTLTTSELESLLFTQQDKRGLDVAFVDYIALVNSKGDSGYERVTAIADDLRRQANIFDIPLVAASQLNRASLLSKPTLSALKESGQVENNAGAVFFPYRIPIDDDNPQVDPEVESAVIIVAKNRHGPNNYEIDAEFVPSKMLWRQKITPVEDPQSAYQEQRSIA